MKFKKLKSALMALGILSLAGAAQAQTMIYVTGSTACRAAFYNACTAYATTGIFTNASSGTNVLYDPAGGGSGDSKIMYLGQMAGIGPVILNCSFTGSEAGIAAVAGQSLTQTLFPPTSTVQVGGDPNAANAGTAYALPGVPNPSFYVAAGSPTTGTHVPDLTMADTSQTVSQTPISVAHLTDYGVLGVIPFTWMKGYSSAPCAAWSNIVNVTTAVANQNLIVGDLYNACNYSGISTDTNFGVAIVGRNLGSGTRADCLLNMQVGINTPVQQYAWGANASLYPPSAPGTLTFNTNNSSGQAYASGQNLTSIYNDGFDSGAGVQESMNVDQAGANNTLGVVLIGYMGISDAKHATNDDNTLIGGSGSAPNSGKAVYLSFNGVYEGDQNVINGSYTYWGEEHLLGPVSPTTTQAAAGTAISTGFKNFLSGITLATGTVTSNPAQSYVLPTSIMQVKRGSHPYGSDTGFPVQGSF